MALKTVGKIKDSIAGLLQGINLDNITNLNGAIERAAKTIVMQADLPEATGRQAVTLYNGVYDYLAPASIFGGYFIDLRPQGITRSNWNYSYKKPIMQFDRTKLLMPNGTMVTFENNMGTQIMRVVETTSRVKATLDRMSDASKWTSTGVTNLTDDVGIYYQNPSSVRFDLPAGAPSDVWITKSDLSRFDMTDYKGVGVIFLAVYMPTIAGIGDWSVQIGNNNSNYFQQAVTQGMLGAWKANEWTILAFDLATATQTGTVDLTNITYAAIGVDYNGIVNPNIRVGAFFLSMPAPYELIYGTASIFKVNNTLSDTITDDNDELVLNDASYVLFEYECALTIAIQSGGTLADGLIQMLRTQLHDPNTGLYTRYRANNPSQQVREVGNWYDDNN